MRKHDVVRGLLPFLILKYGQKKDFHGYELIKMFRREFHVYFGPSTIYPLLAVMVKEGLLTKGDWATGATRPIIVYKITQDGLDMIPCSEATLLLVIQHTRTEEPKRLTAPSFWVS